MIIWTSFLLAFREIRRHLLRSFLTVLGIIIGVGAVITMVTLGNGATQAVQDQISSLGVNVLQMRPGQGFGRGGGGPRPPDFDSKDVQAIETQLLGVRTVAPIISSTGTVIHNAANWTTTIYGATNGYFDAKQWKLEEGRYFSDAELQAGKSVCIIGTTIQDNLFRAEDVLGQRMRVSGISCQIVGILESLGQAGFGGDQDDVVFMPLKTVQRRLTGNTDIDRIMIAVDERFDTQTVQKELTSLMRERRNILAGQEDNFNIFDTKQISDTLSGTTQILTALLGAVAAVSLLVGGIGIMNIMLVSVTERTREIGIRLAIGAVASEVLLQFLIEAVVLSSLGGLIGIAIALGTSLIAAPIIKVPFAFDWQINLLAFVFSAGIGVIFGYFPARRAARLNPIDALRHE